MTELKFGLPDIWKHECKSSEKLRDIIIYLSFSLKYLTLIRLVKLIYVSEFYFIDKFSKRLTDSNFYKWDYGPWCPDIEYTGTKMAGNEIKIKEETTEEGFEAHFFEPNIKVAEINLTEKEAKVLDAVICDWKYMPTKSLIMFCKQTKPFLDVEMGDIIDFGRYIKFKKPKVLGFDIEIEKEEDGRYSVYSLNPELDGCFSFSETKENAIQSFKDALISYLDCKAKYSEDCEV